MIQITDAPLLAGTMSRPGSNHRTPQEKDAQVPVDAPDLRMVIYTPFPEANTAQKLAQLADEPALFSAHLPV